MLRFADNDFPKIGRLHVMHQLQAFAVLNPISVFAGCVVPANPPHDPFMRRFVTKRDFVDETDIPPVEFIQGIQYILSWNRSVHSWNAEQSFHFELVG